jgi:uncharacterized membrane protein YeaQ/YmgE (transglycosylase-associated protein family)
MSEELPVGIIGWIVLGAIAGFIADRLMGGRSGVLLSIIIGIVGALLGGWLGKVIFHVHGLGSFFDIKTWITAIVGAVILIFLARLVTGRERA